MKSLSYVIVKVVTIVWFITHFLLTIIYVLPLNPIKIQLKPLIDASTMSSFFSQNWSLFAPNPVSQDYIMLVQPLRVNDPAELTSKGWYNLSSPLWKHFQSSRVSAYDRLARSQSSALRSTLTGDHGLKNLFDACEKGDSVACTTYRTLLASVRKNQIEKLIKIGSAFCNDISKYDNQYQYMAIRIRIVSFPTWSKRYEGTSTINDLELGIHRIDKTIAPFDLFN